MDYIVRPVVASGVAGVLSVVGDSVDFGVRCVDGIVNAPDSKSYAQRALLASFLAGGDAFDCVGDGNSEDVEALYEALLQLKGGVSEVSIGESGLACRLVVPLVGVLGREVVIDGRGTILNRSMEEMIGDLRRAGLEIVDNEGKLPLQVGGEYDGDVIFVDGRGGSQFLSGLLFALPIRQKDTKVMVMGLKSRPYVDMTLEVIKAFGVVVEHENYEKFVIKGAQKYVAPIDYKVEGDWSGASAILVAGAALGRVVVRGLKKGSSQADANILKVLSMVGASVKWNDDGNLEVAKGGRLKGFEFDATDCPDLICALVALAVLCEGESRIKGAQRLRNKESDRAEALTTEFNKMGANVCVDGDVMCVEGGLRLHRAIIDSRNDHRIAMATAVAGLVADGEVKIENAQCVGKSYKSFFEDLESISCY